MAKIEAIAKKFNAAMEVKASPVAAARLRKIITMREEAKRLYDEADEIMEDILDSGIAQEGEVVVVGGKRFAVVDQFRDTNVVWRSTPVRRYDLKEIKK